MVKRGYWICQLLGWSIYLVSAISMTSIFTGGFQIDYLFNHLITAFTFFLITHYSRNWLKGKFTFKQGLYKILGTMILFVIFASSVGVIVVIGVVSLTSSAPSWPALSNFYIIYTSIAVTFMSWISLYAGFKIFLNYRENEVQKWKLEAKLLETEISALKAQINPHFVFNALNNIRSLISENTEKARKAITTLSKLLRISLRYEDKLVIPLDKELAIVKEYLNLERLHYEDRLQVFWNLASVEKTYCVPALGIQTVVENAIKHGISSIPGGGMLRISTCEKESKLVINVINPGQLKNNGKSKEGTGLVNLRKRLNLFDERSKFTIRELNNTVNAEIILYSYEDINR